MTKLINMKGAVALVMALSFCICSVASTPGVSLTLDNSTIVSKPMTSYEARDIEGGALPLIAAAIAASPTIVKVVVATVAVDAVIIAGSFALYGMLATDD